jgi:hypothetical protein
MNADVSDATDGDGTALIVDDLLVHFEWTTENIDGGISGGFHRRMIVWGVLEVKRSLQSTDTVTASSRGTR